MQRIPKSQEGNANFQPFIKICLIRIIMLYFFFSKRNKTFPRESGENSRRTDFDK